MDLLVFGLNHKTAPIHVRERLALTETDQPQLALEATRSGIREAMLLSTCNRVELYGALDPTAHTTASESTIRLEETLIDLLAKRSQLSAVELRPHVYLHRGDQALIHLFRVASSLDSMVIGEPQILGQLKSAFERCREAGVTGHALNMLMERAFTVARKVRSQTGIGQNVVSISSVAVNLARHIFDDLSKRTALLIGAGEMGELAAQHLKTEGVSRLLVANRNFERAADLAGRLGGRPRRLDELFELLCRADIVITSTGAREYLITSSMILKVLKARKYKPLFLIDIAVPRNIDPSINEIDNVYLYDVDDLNGISDENKAHRAREAEDAETLVIAEVARYHQERAQRQLSPAIVAIRERTHQLKALEIEWANAKLSELSADDLKTVAQLGDRLTNKILHQVTTTLKRYAESPQRDQVVEIALNLFGALSREDEETPPSSK